MKRAIRRIHRLTNWLLTASGTVLMLFNLISSIDPIPEQRRITVATLLWGLVLYGRRGLLKRWGL